MKMMRKINLEKLVYLLLIVNPFLDVLSYFFTIADLPFTPSTFLRPIIVTCILVYLLIHEVKYRRLFIAIGVIYAIYGIIHLAIYKGFSSSVSAGSVFSEAQYVFNYTYLIMTLLAFLIVVKDKQQIIKWTFISGCIYTSIIYISIITKTYGNTYLEGFGIKSWFNTGGQIGAILIFIMFISVPILFNYGKKYVIAGSVFYALSAVYLVFLIGTRMGLMGVFSILGVLFIASIIYVLNKNSLKNINKKYVIICAGAVVILLSGVGYIGSSTLERRKFLDKQVVDTAHISIDLQQKIIEEDKDKKSYEIFDEDQYKASVKLEKWANEKKLPNTDLRAQQTKYNYLLVKEQESIMGKLFGNGHLNVHYSMVLEREPQAILYNFGIIGFILYFVPFIAILFYSIYKIIIKRKDASIYAYTLVGGLIISYFIAYSAGHIFFNAAIVPFVCLMHVILLLEVPNEKNSI